MATKGKAEAVAGLDSGVALGLYRTMRLIRRFEETVQALFLRGEVHGTTHLYIGQEAVATGVGSAVARGDKVAATYRGHGHALSIGVDPQALLNEMLGRAGGVCGGRAGSMNVVDLERGLIGSFGIIGGSMAAGTGAALSLRRTGGVAVSYFGDGSTNHGYFHECLNFSAVQRLPVVYVCENNLYGEFTPWEDVTAGQIIDRPRAMGITSVQVDGMDVFAVRDAALDAIAQARNGNGPVFIEAMTYRFVGHSRSDPGKYRRPGELDEWKQRDPLKLAAVALEERFDMSANEIAEVDASVDAQMEEAAERALASPYPEPGQPAREFRP
jgi:acetoin:2,6-dichlorophenolindophenol oxidoreductase subunit alpha